MTVDPQHMYSHEAGGANYKARMMILNLENPFGLLVYINNISEL